MRWIVGGIESRLRHGALRAELLATDANIEVLADMSGAWIDKVHAAAH